MWKQNIKFYVINAGFLMTQHIFFNHFTISLPQARSCTCCVNSACRLTSWPWCGVSSPPTSAYQPHTRQASVCLSVQTLTSCKNLWTHQSCLWKSLQFDWSLMIKHITNSTVLGAYRWCRHWSDLVLPTQLWGIKICSFCSCEVCFVFMCQQLKL